MLSIRPTEHLTGATISGDYWDFEDLIQAIYEVVGDEKRYFQFEGSRNRLLSVCLKLRQASQGAHLLELVANGINKGISKKQKTIYPEKNIYFAVDVFLPEMLFMALSLNDFIALYKETIDDSDWNIPVTTIRKFQAQVADCIEPFMSEENYVLFLTTLHTKSPLFHQYSTQYVDVLNLEYLALSKEERATHLTSFALRLLAEDETYKTLKKQLHAVTSISKQSLHEIPLNLKYPDEETIIW